MKMKKILSLTILMMSVVFAGAQEETREEQQIPEVNPEGEDQETPAMEEEKPTSSSDISMHAVHGL